jgi:hypothetical protein
VYRTLDYRCIVTTLETLGNRIRERFPESSLGRVSGELLEFARQSGERIDRLRRPYWWLRFGIAMVIVVIIAVTLTAVLLSMEVSRRADNVFTLLQGLDAAVNELILLAIAFYFLFSLEGRLKRREALKGLHQLRSIAHVIDMHQLTKDPEVVVAPAAATPSSPQRTMTPFELCRYLDYCSELLSLISKLAALHVQYLRDPVVLGAVNDVEELTDGLSRKIWQKINIVDRGAAKDAAQAQEAT